MQDNSDQPSKPQSLADMVNNPPSADEPGVTDPATMPASVAAPGPMSVITPQSAAPKVSRQRLPKKLIAVIAAFFIIGGSAAAYVTVFNNSPEDTWKSALTNTATGLDKFIELSYEEQKSYKIDGNFSVSEPVIIDGSSSGQFNSDTNSGQFKFDIGASGIRIDTEIIADGSSSSTPDLYFKIGGLEGVAPLLSSFGGEDLIAAASLLGEINGQWYVVDHTLLDGVLNQTESSDAPVEMLTPEDLRELSSKFSAVMRDRFFSTDDDKAVFKLDDSIGEEDFEGIKSYKYKVSVNKSNLKDFAIALKDVAKDTKLETILLMGQTDKTLEEALRFENIIDSIENSGIDSRYAHVWVEVSGGFIRNVRLYPVEDKKDTNYLDVLLNYEGGDVFPFLIRATVDDLSNKGQYSLGIDINQKSGDTKLTLDIDLQSSGSDIVAEAQLATTSADADFNVVVPEGAKNALDLITALGSLGQSLLPSVPSSSLYDYDSLYGPEFNLENYIDDVEL